MARIQFIFLLFIASLSGFAQGFNSPVRPVVDDQALVLRYGKDRNSWPIWARGSVNLSNGMSLDIIDVSDISCNGDKIRFDEGADFQEMRSVTSIKKVIQNGFTFAYVNDEWIFDTSVLAKNMTQPIQCKLEFNGIELNELSTIKEKFPKSYDWRDGQPNMLKRVTSEDLWDDMVLVVFGMPGSTDLLQLFYYQEELFCIYRGVLGTGN
ncbi:hypothetical protein ACV07N_02340 [Roseivirga echinicomitans]